jgi:hypothetical protein
MKRLIFVIVLLGLFFVTNAFAATLSLDCKVVTGAEKVSAGFERDFCESLVDSLEKTGEIRISTSSTADKLKVALTVTAHNSADVLVSWQQTQPASFLINSRDSDLRPLAAQALVLPILNLIKARKS